MNRETALKVFRILDDHVYEEEAGQMHRMFNLDLLARIPLPGQGGPNRWYSIEVELYHLASPREALESMLMVVKELDLEFFVQGAKLVLS